MIMRQFATIILFLIGILIISIPGCIIVEFAKAHAEQHDKTYTSMEAIGIVIMAIGAGVGTLLIVMNIAKRIWFPKPKKKKLPPRGPKPV